MRISENREPVQAAEGSRPGLVGRLFGSLTGLRTSEGSGGKSKATTRGLPAPGTYKIGEVRGEYVKVCKIASLDRLLSLTGRFRMQPDNSPYCHWSSMSLLRMHRIQVEQ